MTPDVPLPGQNNLDLPLSHILKSNKQDGPASKPQVTLPVSGIVVVEAMHQEALYLMLPPHSPKTSQTSLSWHFSFFCMRDEEDTLPAAHISHPYHPFPSLHTTIRSRSGYPAYGHNLFRYTHD